MNPLSLYYLGDIPSGERAIAPCALADHRVLLMGEGHCFRDQVLDACAGLADAVREQSAKGEAPVEGSSLETLKHMVASGLGITVLPKSAALESSYDKNNVVVVPFLDPPPSRSIALAWRASFPRPEAIDLLINALRARPQS